MIPGRIRSLLIAAAALPLGACVEGTLEVNEPMPVADAGFDQVIYLGTAGERTVELSGLGSCDPQRTSISDDSWNLVDGPSDVTVDFDTSGHLRASFVASTPGEYLVGLRVAAGDRESPMDYVLVSVREGDGDDVIIPPVEVNACGERVAVEGRPNG